MANNKLIARDVFFEHDIWFSEGLYEDNEFCAKLYNRCEGVDLLNFQVHKWYQYGAGESITKTFTPESISQKVDSLERSWLQLNPDQRKRRIQFNLSSDLPHFFRNLGNISHPDAQALRSRMLTYVEQRSSYIEPSLLSAAARAFLDQLRHAPVGLSKTAGNLTSSPPRHFFFVRTHFYLLWAVFLTVSLDLQSIVVVPRGASGFVSGFWDRVAKLGVFLEVRQFDPSVIGRCFELIVRSGDSATGPILTILRTSLDASIGPVREHDTAVIYLDGLPESYYARVAFSSVIKVEDGPGSINREISLETRNGVWGTVARFLDSRLGGFSPLRGRVTQVITGVAPVNPGFFRRYPGCDVSVCELDVSAPKCRPVFERLVKEVYRPGPIPVYIDTLVATQPLFFNYCSREENFAVVAYLISRAEGSRVVIKPHPMDATDYGRFGFDVLPASFPLELLQVVGVRVGRGITFGSSSLANNPAFSKVDVLFPPIDVTFEDVQAQIRKVCYDLGAMELSLVRRYLEDVVLLDQRSVPTDFGELALEVRRRSVLIRKLRTAGRLLVTDRSKFWLRLRSNLCVGG